MRIPSEYRHILNAFTYSPMRTDLKRLLEEFLLQDFAIIMTVAGIALVLFRFINQPPALGYLVAGIIVGPFTLPLIGVGSPIHSHETIRTLASWGCLYCYSRSDSNLAGGAFEDSDSQFS